MIIGIILAAGASTRMGRPKALLPIGPDTFVVRLARSFISAEIDDLVVVTSTEDRVAVESSLGDAGICARVAENPHRDEGQLSSLQVGLTLADKPGVVAVVVGLVDVPAVAASTIRSVVDEFHRSPAPIVRPAFGDRHGHPVLFARSVFDELRHADQGQGAKAVVRAHNHEVVNLPTDDEGACADVDTPADYVRLIGSVSGT